MRSKVTVVLLFLNVVLFFYIFKFEEKWRAERAMSEAKRRVLPPEIASLESFTRTAPTGESVRLEKQRDGTWWLTKPHEWPANPNAISRIHNELQFLEHETSFAVADLAKGSQTLADYGLDNPALTLDLGAAGKSYRLLIGDDTKTGNRLYLLTPDTGRIHVVSRSLAESVGLPLAELRTDSIFTIPVFEVRSLNIQTGAPANLKVRLRRDQGGRWGFETPILARANKAGVETTINSLNSLTVKSFPEGVDPARTGLDAPVLRVTFEGNARRETLLLGQAAGDGALYARFEDKDVVFTTAVPAPLLEVLRASQEALRDRHVLEFDRAAVTAITLTAPGQPDLSLQKLEAAPAAGSPAPAAAPGGPSWQVVTRTNGQAPLTAAADAGVVNDLLDRLQKLSVVKFLSDAPSATDVENYGFNRPEREITLGLATGGGLNGNEPSTQVLQIGVSPDRPGAAYARLMNPPFVYEIHPDILDDTPLRARHYRERLLRKLPEGAQLTGMTLVDLAGGEPLFALKLTPGEKTWERFLATIEPESVRQALQVILDELVTLRAAAFTADSFSSEQAATPEGSRPWRYRLDYTVAFAGSPETPASLFLTERLGGMTLVAGTAEFGGVTFTVTQPLLDALFTLTYTAKQDPGPAAPPATPETKGTTP
ncbi:MAG: DUF4340 domain-containing protein [Verrucomicrobiota bacterium]